MKTQWNREPDFQLFMCSLVTGATFVNFIFHESLSKLGSLSGKGCGLWLWHSLDFSLTFFEQEKDLGVIIGQKLTFSDHINSKVNSANKNLGIIFRTFTWIDEEMFLNLYKSIVTHLEYATPVWSPLYKKDKIILENAQRRATRLVSSCKNLSYQQRLCK